MRPLVHRGAAVVAAVVLPVLLAGCGSDDDGGAEAQDSAGGSSALPRSDEPVTLDPATTGPDVTNPWFPLTPGTRWTYRETDEDGNVMRVVVTASTETRMIANGVEARVVRDTVTQDGEVVEDTLDWYAQDADGNVWYLGEDTAEFKDGKVDTTEGSWESGVDGALPGVIMPADPQVGMSYRQEYLEGVAEDSGEVIGLDGTADVPAGSYDQLVKTADTDGLEPDVLEHKLYARGIGVVLTVDVGSQGREELLSMTTVPDAAAERAGTTPLGEAY